ncbi:hypothetical protein EDB84DRAFT_1579789 [Lactarius hengduanensis]|nr:hypothetical protein EDB84DRAFT_1579789 [Lactarius hengduanensis]
MAHPGLYVWNPPSRWNVATDSYNRLKRCTKDIKLRWTDMTALWFKVCSRSSSGDLRYGFEDKYLLTRVRQARLYCNRVGETLRMIQMAVEKAIDMRAHSVQIRVPV